MSEVGEKMLSELRRIREALEGAQPLGFGKKLGPTYVFARHHEVGGETYLWYSRDKSEGQNVSIRERDLTGYLVGVWRFDRADDATGEAIPKLNIQVRADKDYIIQTGSTTNFARTFLDGLLELVEEPLTLVVEDNAGSKAQATVFCRVESGGVRNALPLILPVLSGWVSKEKGKPHFYIGRLNIYAEHDPISQSSPWSVLGMLLRCDTPSTPQTKNIVAKTHFWGRDLGFV